MNLRFLQTASLSFNGPIADDFCEKITVSLLRGHEIKYVCTATPDGYFLQPKFGATMRKNAFLPEVRVVVSQHGTQTLLKLEGQPVKSIRVFIWCYIAFALLMEIVFLGIAAITGLHSVILPFIPAFLCIFGYALCLFGTKIGFRAVVKVMEDALN